MLKQQIHCDNCQEAIGLVEYGSMTPTLEVGGEHITFSTAERDNINRKLDKPEVRVSHRTQPDSARTSSEQVGAFSGTLDFCCVNCARTYFARAVPKIFGPLASQT